MNNLAVVIVSCDRYSWFRKYWYHYFNLNFGWEYPVYMIVEEKADPIEGVTMIQKPMEAVSKWTKMVREAVAEIPEDNLFIMMDDFLIVKRITDRFADLYDLFKQVDADALRIMAVRGNNCRTRPTDFGLDELLPGSPYLISYSPNFWKKSFLLKCIQEDETPWKSEVDGSGRVRDAYILSTTINGWYQGGLQKGKVMAQAKHLIKGI